MSKTIPAALQAHLDSGSTTLARLWKVTRTDGVVYGFTDHDRPLEYLGVLYRASSAFDASAIASRDSLSVDNLELQGLLDSEGITAADIEAGAWDGAALVVYRVNWADLSMGHETLITGDLGEVQRKSGQYVAEIRGLLHHLTNRIGRAVYPSCDASLGDARCGIDLDGSPSWRQTTTVASASSRSAFVIVSGYYPQGWFDNGVVEFLSGANTGRSAEIKTHTAIGSPATSAGIEVQLPMPYDIAASDSVRLTTGCDKTKATCISKFGNVLNFRGFSYVPGNDAVTKFGGQ